MEDLNKHQVVLLTLLVSFVTSIATGITTVSLLEQTPTRTVTSTVNRVVEKTIEKVTNNEEENISVERTPEKEIVTVVVNQEDLTVEAVAQNSSSIARIYQVNNQGTEIYITNGLVVSGSGRLIANKNFINTNKNYIAEYSQGKYSLNIFNVSAETPMISFEPVGDSLPTFSSISFVDSNSIQLGQTLIHITGSLENSVSSGIVSSTESDGDTISAIHVSIDGAQTTLFSFVVNLQGEVAGIKIGNYAASTVFTASNIIQNYLNSI